MKQPKKDLFTKWRYSSIEWNNRGIHAGEKEPASKALIPLMQTAVLVCIAYLLWLFIHESIHYFACLSLGSQPYVSSFLPNPEITCVSLGYMPPGEAFIYTLAPYMAAIVLLAGFDYIESRFLKLLSYAAFMDLQLNLMVSTLFFGIIKGKKNDAFHLLEYLGKASAGFDVPMVLYVGFIVLLIVSSLIIFRKRLQTDMEEKEEKEFFSAALSLLLAIYALNTILLLA